MWFLFILLFEQKLSKKFKMPRAKADSNKPRGRMTAYAYFMQTCRQEHKNKHPDENVVFLEFSKKCAGQWKVILKFETLSIPAANG